MNKSGTILATIAATGLMFSVTACDNDEEPEEDNVDVNETDDETTDNDIQEEPADDTGEPDPADNGALEDDDSFVEDDEM